MGTWIAPFSVYHINEGDKVYYSGNHIYKIESNITGISYYCNKKYHREDGPAKTTALGNEYYFIHGQLHREDGPAVILKGKADPLEKTDHSGWYLYDKYFGPDKPDDWDNIILKAKAQKLLET